MLQAYAVRQRTARNSEVSKAYVHHGQTFVKTYSFSKHVVYERAILNELRLQGTNLEFHSHGPPTVVIEIGTYIVLSQEIEEYDEASSETASQVLHLLPGIECRP